MITVLSAPESFTHAVSAPMRTVSDKIPRCISDTSATLEDQPHMSVEFRFGEFLSGCLQVPRVELLTIQPAQRTLQGIRGRFPVKETTSRLDDLQRAAAAESNHGLTAGQRLHHGHAEIFFSGNDQRPASGVEIAELDVRHAPAELDRGTGETL